MSYYWPLTVKFRVRQATDPTRDPGDHAVYSSESADLGLAPGDTVTVLIKASDVLIGK